MGSKLFLNERGGYRFLEGIEPYSSGVIAEPGREIVHVRLVELMPWHDGLLSARRYLESLGIDHHALCGVELRCPRPHSMGGFIEFNGQYRALLEDWDMWVEGQNPVARTNVAPVVDPPAETMLHAFSYVTTNDTTLATFVVAGGGELPHRDLDSKHIIRAGDLSDAALREKAECVIGIMRRRLNKLGASDSRISTIDVYTAHRLERSLSDIIIPGIPIASRLGVNWYYSRPPIEDIEFEMDIRGVAREDVVALS